MPAHFDVISGNLFTLLSDWIDLNTQKHASKQADEAEFGRNRCGCGAHRVCSKKGTG
jgi:hypothetical protein